METGRHGRNRPGSVTHRLKVSPSFKPVKQKRRSFAPERQKAINEEVDKLLQANEIREVEYPEWLANVVLVKKENASGGFASISHISTGLAQKIAFLYLGLTSYWTPRPVMNSSTSWTPSLATIRSVWIPATKRRPHSSLSKEPTVIERCPSD